MPFRVDFGPFLACFAYMFPISFHYLSDIVPTILGTFLRFFWPVWALIFANIAIIRTISMLFCGFFSD